MVKWMLAAILGLAVAGCAKDGGTREQTVKMSDVPAAVRTAFEKEFPGARVKEVEKETYADGTVHYEFEFVSRDGKNMEAEFNADGDRLEEH